MKATLRHIYLCRTANMSWRTCAVVKQIQSNPIQVGCSCAWSISLLRESNTGATKEIPALNQSWWGCDHPTSNWPCRGHQIPYLVPRTTDCLSPLWSNIEHWPYALGVCSIIWMSWRILHSRIIEYPLWDNSRDLHGEIPTRSGILLSDMNGHTIYTRHHCHHWTIS